MTLAPNYSKFEDDIEDSLEWSTRKVFGEKFSDAIDNYLSNAVYGGPSSPVAYTGSGTRPVEFELDYQSIDSAAQQIADELQYYFEQSFVPDPPGNVCANVIYSGNDFSSVSSTAKPLLVQVFSKFNNKRTAAEEIAAALDAGIKTFKTSHTESASECSASFPNIPIN